MLVGKSSFRVVLPYSIFLFFIFAVLVFSSLPFGEKEVVAAEAAATKTTPVTKKFYDEKKFKEFQENLLNYDTDKDGFSDADELIIYSTSPTNRKINGKTIFPEEIEKIKARKMDYGKLLIAVDLLYCNQLYDFDGSSNPLFTREMIKKELNLNPEETERMEENLGEDIRDWFYEIGPRISFNSKNINKYCSNLKKKAWQQIEMTINQQCSGYSYDEWLKITKIDKKNYPDPKLVSEAWGNIIAQGMADACPNSLDNIYAIHKKEIDALQKKNRYLSIHSANPYKNDLVYSAMIGPREYLIYAKSGKKELIPKGYEYSEISVYKNDIIIKPYNRFNSEYDDRDWFLYKNGKVSRIFEDGVPSEKEAYDCEKLKIKNGSIINIRCSREDTDLESIIMKDSKPYKTILGNVTSLIAYKDTFLAAGDSLYLDSKNKFLFNGFYIRKRLIIGDMIYVLASKEGSFYILSFDGNTEKEIKKLDSGVVVPEILTLKNEPVFTYYDTKIDSDKKCSKSRADQSFYCLKFLNQKQSEGLDNMEVYGKYPSRMIWVSRDKKNIVIQTGPNSFNINGKEKKYDTDSAYIMDYVYGYGICYNDKKTSKPVCTTVKGKTYPLGKLDRNTVFIVGDEKMSPDLRYLVYENKLFHVEDVTNKKNKNITEQALFIDDKEVVRCAGIKIVYIDEKEKGVVYYTCQYDQSQGGGEALKKITIK